MRCFTLRPKGSDKNALLTEVDEALCKHFNVPVHPTKYFRPPHPELGNEVRTMNWFDSIGYMLACGESFEEIRAYYQSWDDDTPDWLKQAYINTVNYLDEHYTSDSFYEAKVG